MRNSNIFKYIFAAVVVVLIIYTIFVITQNKKDEEAKSLDQTSTVSNIQTDLRLAIAGLDTINPITTNNRNVQDITKIIYDPLITLNEHYKLEYCLAEEIAKNDDYNYTVKLRKGVLWEDKSALTANDVIFTIDRIKSLNCIYSENLRHVIDLQYIDSNTLKIVLDQPVDFFEYNLTFPIMCEKYYEGEDFASSGKVPIGTGMFRISEISDNVIKLVPNPYYWNTERKPMATEISINLYGTIGEVYSAFKNGELDILSVKISDIETYIGNLGYNRVEYKSRDYDFLTINTQHELLSDVNVRKALSLFIDKNNVVAGLGPGYVVSNFSLDMGNWLYTKNLNVETNVDLASQILEQDGWVYNNVWQKNIEGRNRRLEFSISVNEENLERVRAVENIKEQLANYGINVTIKYLSRNAYIDAINNKNYEVILTGITLGFNPSLRTFFGNDNIANYYNQEMLDLMNEASNTTDENVLYNNYNRIYDIYLDEVPYIGLYRNTDIIVSNQGLVSNLTANSFNIYHNIEKWYRQ